MESEITALQLNNLIVQCRSIVKRSKVRCVRKLLNQINLLKNKSGTEDQKEKNQRKVNRLLSELSEIKKLNSDDITKFALINTTSFVDLMKKATTADKVALYKVAFCDLLVNKIDEIRDKYPRWPIEIPFILQRLGLQYKMKKSARNQSRKPLKSARNIDQKRKSENKKQFSVQRIGSEAVLKPSKDEEKEFESKNAISNAPVKAERQKTKGSKKKTSQTVAETKKDNEDDRKNEQSKHPGKSFEIVNLKNNEDTKNEQSKHSEKSSEIVNLKEGRFGQMEVRRLKLDEIFHDEISPIFPLDPPEVVSEEMDCKSKKTSPKNREHDPFFADTDDSNFPAVSIREDETVELDSLLDDETDSKNCIRRNTGYSFRDKLSSRSNNEKRPPGALKPRQEKNFNKDRRAPKSNNRNANLIPLGQPSAQHAPFTGENRKQRRLKLRQEAEKAAELATLHPSWRAKKVQQQSISLIPSGKKIKFTDDNDDGI